MERRHASLQQDGSRNGAEAKIGDEPWIVAGLGGDHHLASFFNEEIGNTSSSIEKPPRLGIEAGMARHGAGQFTRNLATADLYVHVRPGRRLPYRQPIGGCLKRQSKRLVTQ